MDLGRIRIGLFELNSRCKLAFQTMLFRVLEDAGLIFLPIGAPERPKGEEEKWTADQIRRKRIIGGER